MASCWTSREAAVVRHRREETTLAWSGISRIDLILLVGKAGIVRGNTPWDRKACFEAFRLGCCGLLQRPAPNDFKAVEAVGRMHSEGMTVLSLSFPIR